MLNQDKTSKVSHSKKDKDRIKRKYIPNDNLKINYIKYTKPKEGRDTKTWDDFAVTKRWEG